MARELFRDVTNPSVKVGSRQWHTLPLSILAHIFVITLLIVVPLMAGDILPTPRELTAAFVAAPPPPAPPPPPARTPMDVQRRIVEPDSTLAPVEAPQAITRESGLVEAEPEAIVANVLGVVGGTNVPTVESLPPVAAVPSPLVHVGGTILPPKKIRDVSPVYSPIAQSNRVQGVVILEATIGADGRVQQVRVLRSIPLLDASAIEAAKQWQYTPTLLNGVPVPVVMSVTVNFQLR